jgi:hypothetical protein
MSGNGVSPKTDCCKSNIEAQIEAKRAGRRKNVFHGGALCSGCYSEPPKPGQRYGAECHRKAARASYHRKQEELKRLRALVNKGDSHAGQ